MSATKTVDPTPATQDQVQPVKPPESPQHPLYQDPTTGAWLYRLHCHVCGLYEDDAPAKFGPPAVDFLCEEHEEG